MIIISWTTESYSIRLFKCDVNADEPAGTVAGQYYGACGFDEDTGHSRYYGFGV
jgi:hypothetical protein